MLLGSVVPISCGPSYVRRLYMLFERCHTKIRKRHLKQHMKYVHFRSKIQMDHSVMWFQLDLPFKLPSKMLVCPWTKPHRIFTNFVYLQEDAFGGHERFGASGVARLQRILSLNLTMRGFVSEISHAKRMTSDSNVKRAFSGLQLLLHLMEWSEGLFGVKVVVCILDKMLLIGAKFSMEAERRVDISMVCRWSDRSRCWLT